MADKDHQSAKQKAIAEKDKGNKFFTQGKYLEAMVAYSRAIALDHSDPIFFSNLAQTLINLHRYEEAVSNCNKAIGLNPKHVKSYMRRATAYSALQKFDKAIADLEIATKLEPANTKIKQDYDNAVEEYNVLKAAEAKREREKTNAARRPVSVPLTKLGDDDDGDTDDTLGDSLDEPPDPLSFAVQQKTVSSSKAATPKPSPVSPAPEASQPTQPKPTGSLQASTKLQSTTPAEEPQFQAAKKPNLPARAPTSFYTFEQHWVSVKSDQEVLGEYFKMIPLASYPKLFGDSLSVEILMSIVQTIHNRYVKTGEVEFAVSMVEALSKTSRIDILTLLLSTDQSKALKDAVTALEATVSTDESHRDRLLAAKRKLLSNLM